MSYSYLCHQRPPMPGAIPKEGLISVSYPPEGVENTVIDGVMYNCWGKLTYSRPLSDRELSDYELIFLKGA